MTRPVVGSAEEPRHFLAVDGAYRGHLPSFYDPDSVSAAAVLRDAFPTIRDEVLGVIERTPAAFNVNFTPDPSMHTPGLQTLNLCSDLLIYHAHQRMLPHTAAVCESLPGMIFAQVARLMPGCGAPPHMGDTNLVYRLHLGLDVPSEDVTELGIRVADESRGWADGQVLVIEDAHLHCTWNRTDRPRTILIVDVIKDEVHSSAHWLAAMGAAGVFLQVAAARSTAVKRLPRPALRMLQTAGAIPIAAGLPLQRRFPYVTPNLGRRLGGSLD